MKPMACGFIHFLCLVRFQKNELNKIMKEDPVKKNYTNRFAAILLVQQTLFNRKWLADQEAAREN